MRSAQLFALSALRLQVNECPIAPLLALKSCFEHLKTVTAAIPYSRPYKLAVRTSLFWNFCMAEEESLSQHEPGLQAQFLLSIATRNLGAGAIWQSERIFSDESQRRELNKAALVLNKSFFSSPEIAQLPVLVCSGGDLLLSEEQVCQVMDPLGICRWHKALPITRCCFLHSPIRFSLDPINPSNFNHPKVRLETPAIDVQSVCLLYCT